MNHWSEYPFVRILFAYLAGILICLFTPLQFPAWILPVLFLVTWLGQLYLHKKAIRTYRYTSIIGLGFQLAVFAFGNVHTFDCIDINDARHYIHITDNASFLVVKITEPPLEKERSIKVVVEVIAYKTGVAVRPAFGKSILYLSKDSVVTSLLHGNVLLVKNNFRQVAAPANPGQFDYKKYLWYKEVYATAYLQKDDWHLLPLQSANPLYAFTFRLRDLSVNALQTFITSPREAAVAVALVIGFKDNMSPETMQSYTAAGVVHVLAVSGLHVAILFALLHQLLFFLNRKKYGKIIQSVLILLVIWIFSMVTGLSGSVVRAATMFSFITIGKNMKQPVNLFNLLACSAMVILLADPLLVMDVGFQLSYIAVLGIGTLNRYIDHWLPRENKLIDYLWKMVAMSLAAQIATLPLTTYYFHQFPTYFLLANIVVIPAAGLLLHLGILLIAIHFLPPLAAVTGALIRWITYAMNEFIANIQHLPGSVIQLPGINLLQFLLLGILTIAVSHYFITLRTKWLFTTLICLIGLPAIHAIDACLRFHENTITLYSFKGASALEFRSGNSLPLFKKNGSIRSMDSIYLQQRWRLAHIRNFESSDQLNASRSLQKQDTLIINAIYQFCNYRMAVIQQPMVSDAGTSKIIVDALVIAGNPRLRLEDLLDKFTTNTIIFDATNSRYRINKWEEEANHFGLVTYDVKMDGAFVVRL
ncbi:MAG: ComEC family competence protein [Chitinophagaceae bacterium]|nr:ComEC family competence protein [Chitinophagaceae bacterium]